MIVEQNEWVQPANAIISYQRSTLGYTKKQQNYTEKQKKKNTITSTQLGK